MEQIRNIDSLKARRARQHELSTLALARLATAVFAAGAGTAPTVVVDRGLGGSIHCYDIEE